MYIQRCKFPEKAMLSLYPPNFDKLCFHSQYKIFYISLEISSMAHCYLEFVTLICMYLGFPVNFLLVTSSLIPFCSESRHYIISILLNLLKCVLWPRMCSIMVNISCELRMYTLKLLDEAVYRCQLCPAV